MLDAEREVQESFKTIVQAIDDKKGFNVVGIDVRGICNFTDFFVIAEGNVDVHLQAIGRQVTDEMAKIGQKPCSVDGDRYSGWRVYDFGHIIVHLFLPDERNSYQLERVWKDGQLVDLNEYISVPKKIEEHYEKA